MDGEIAGDDILTCTEGHGTTGLEVAAHKDILASPESGGAADLDPTFYNVVAGLEGGGAFDVHAAAINTWRERLVLAWANVLVVESAGAACVVAGDVQSGVGIVLGLGAGGDGVDLELRV